MAVNHNGDSDSIGAAVGNIMGTYLGEDKIPKEWKNKIELSKELHVLSKDLLLDTNKIPNIEKRYPIN